MNGSDQAHKIDGHVGARIADRRQQLGLSQAELAAAVGVVPDDMSEMERGEQRASAAILFRLCQALACHPRDLLG